MTLAMYVACALAMIGIYHVVSLLRLLRANHRANCKRTIFRSELAYYRGSLANCPKCGQDHADVAAFELTIARPDGCNFALICPETGNEIFIRVDQASAVES